MRRVLFHSLLPALLVWLLPALVLAAPLASYVPLPECCKGHCTADGCPIEARRAPARAETAPDEAAAESCHAEEEVAHVSPAEVHADAAHSSRHSTPSVQAPRACGEDCCGLTSMQRAASTSHLDASPAATSTATNRTPASIPRGKPPLSSEARGPPTGR